MAKNNLVLENVEILPGGFKNFSGKPGQYNAEGDRNFCVVIPDNLVQPMTNDGWNIKELAPKEEGDAPKYFIRVRVRFNSNRPPKVVMITSGGQVLLDEESVDVLDWSDIISADMAINPYQSTYQGKPHVTGYLKSLYVTIEEDELERKYGSIPQTEMPVFEDPDDDTPF